MIGRIQSNRAADRDTATFLNFEERNSVKLTAARTQSILEAAVKRAVDECIREGILEDFFRKNKAEVIAMSIFEYDEKEVIDYIREEERAIGREEGKKEGKVEGRMEGKKEEAQKYGRLILRLTEEGKSSLVAKIATDDALRERLYEEYQL